MKNNVSWIVIVLLIILASIPKAYSVSITELKNTGNVVIHEKTLLYDSQGGVLTQKELQNLERLSSVYTIIIKLTSYE